MMRVVICAITLKRLPGLHRLLDSIAALQFQKTAPEVSVLIMDNDLNGSARELVTGMATTFPFKLTYAMEPARGISAARNRAVRIADGVDFLAFIDDDETVYPGWLEQLLLKQIETDADIVMGPVTPEFEAVVPEWIVRGEFFVKDHVKFGNKDGKYGSTANILIRKKYLDSLAEPFAEKFNLTGGADYHLLLRLKAMGANMDWAPAAMVTELVKPDRTNARWILKRRFRIGNTIAMAERSLTPAALIVRPLKGFFRIIQGCIMLPLALWRGKAEMVNRLGLISFGCGNLAGCCGYQYREYEPGKNDRD